MMRPGQGFTDVTKKEFMKSYLDYVTIDRAYRFWFQKMPKLRFDSKWDVMIMPPFGGAMVRFWVSYKDHAVSVYFDAYDMCGYEQNPYWEIFPNETGECDRFAFGDEDKMMKKIKKLLNQKKDDQR